MAASWTPISGSPRSMRSVQALTEAEPSGSDGILLDYVYSIAPIIRAPVGQTFTGAGTMLAYVRSNGIWAPYKRGHYDLADAAGLPDFPLDVYGIASPREFFALIASGVVLSGAGTQITVDFMVVTKGNVGIRG